MYIKIFAKNTLFSLVLLLAASVVNADSTTVTIPTAGLPIVDFGVILTFIIRVFLVVAGVSAIIYGLRGGLDWILSEGEKDKVASARKKIIAAFVGIFVMIFVLTIAWTLEQVVFNRAFCFGISCDIRVPSLVGEDNGSGGGGTSGGGGGSGGGGAPAPTPAVFNSCDEYCRSDYSGDAFPNGGSCSLDLWNKNNDCPNNTHTERGLPNQESVNASGCFDSNHQSGTCCCSCSGTSGIGGCP